MHRKRNSIIVAIALIAALAAGGAAFTASNSLPTENIAGYGNVQVTGTTVTDIHNVLSTDGQDITEVVLTFQSAVPQNATVVAGFGPTANTAPTSLPITCTLAVNGLSATCGNGTTSLQTTASGNEFAVAVSH
jgi:hypothetical protein